VIIEIGLPCIEVKVSSQQQSSVICYINGGYDSGVDLPRTRDNPHYGGVNRKLPLNEKLSRLKVFRGSHLTQSTDLCTDISFGGKSTHLTITPISTGRNTKQHTRLYFKSFQPVLKDIVSKSQNWNRCILCHDYGSIAGP
jgi:hypothetical protein